VIEALVQDQAQVLAISASMPAHVDGVAALVRAVRADPRTATTRVVVGGRPFLVDPTLAAAVGADGVGRDARQAVALCAGLVEGNDVAV
jgi:methanogenic corrinoid protein MtbC1